MVKGRVGRVAMLRRRRPCVITGQRRVKEKDADSVVTGRDEVEMEIVSSCQI